MYSFVDGEDLRYNDATVHGHVLQRVVADIAEMPLHWDTVIEAAFTALNNDSHDNDNHDNDSERGTSSMSSLNNSYAPSGGTAAGQRSASHAPVKEYFLADFGPGYYVQQLSRHCLQSGRVVKSEQVEIMDLSLSNEVQFLTPSLSLKGR